MDMTLAYRLHTKGDFTREERHKLLKKPLPHLGNPIRPLKFGKLIIFNLLWGSRQECPEVDFGSFSTMSVPTLSFRKSEPST
jgi:hypothetical protein